MPDKVNLQQPQGSEGNAGDAAGTGRDDTTPQQDAIDRGTSAAPQDTQRDADVTGDRESGGIAALQKRLSEVSGKYRPWRELGATPEEVAEKLARLEAIEKAARVSREHDDGGDEAVQRRAEVFRAIMDESFGDGTAETVEGIRQYQEMLSLAHAKNGIDYLRDILEDHGYQTDDDTVMKWEERLRDEFIRDEALLGQYQNPVTQQEGIKAAFGKLRSDIIDPSLAVMGAGKLAGGRKRREAALGSAQAPTPASLEKDLEPPKDMTDPDKRRKWWKDRIKAGWDSFSGDVGPV